ncbi:elongation of very long chain fatty acids protein 4 [Caerostris extrusa]|uniref:Elongation of very long chain fatty acids protein n=1 Tax=Caerostris extrusa TaxID=172846 RepID=A0AAV4WA87_CAEEX|nr:elongation of very long chain fatty acids protein 4 [Caerostris extrusa]
MDLGPCIRSEHNWVQDLADAYHVNLIEKTDPSVMEWPLVGRDRLNVFLIFCYYAKIRINSDAKDSCKTLDIMHDATTYRYAEITWWFYLTKYVELCDTIFFVLRKKDRQLSRLHLVHHSTVPLLIFALLRSEPGGHNTFFPLANSFVHCVMYMYYAISALGDHVTIHLKFKRYVTMTQMIQFILVLCYIASRPFYGCQVSSMSYGTNLFLAGFFFVLFCNFYWNEYLINKEEARKQNLSNNGVNGKKHS